MSDHPTDPLEYESRVKSLESEMVDAGYCCLKCGGPMATGYFISPSKDGFRPLLWAPGEPVHIKFLGIQLQLVSMRKRNMFRVKTYACKSRGYVESFLR
jgi:hypothetical protein